HKNRQSACGWQFASAAKFYFQRDYWIFCGLRNNEFNYGAAVLCLKASGVKNTLKNPPFTADFFYPLFYPLTS
ncbi:MAG: hypothetical protein AAB817_01990, partial [Patescibacteria group bacterium]